MINCQYPGPELLTPYPHHTKARRSFLQVYISLVGPPVGSEKHQRDLPNT